MKKMKIHSSDLRNKNLTDVPHYIPLGILSEEIAMRNHKQTLDRLNERGGIGIGEALDMVDDGNRRWREDTQHDVNELNVIIKNYVE